MDFRQKYYLHEDIPVFWKTLKRHNSDKLQLVRSDRSINPSDVIVTIGTELVTNPKNNARPLARYFDHMTYPTPPFILT
ncbi:unnamed protein product, partial [Rotaria sp. Silwood2]